MNRQLSPKKSKKWWWIIGISLALVLIIAAIIKGKSRPKGTEVYLEKVTSRDIIETVSAMVKSIRKKKSRYHQTFQVKSSNCMSKKVILSRQDKYWLVSIRICTNLQWNGLRPVSV